MYCQGNEAMYGVLNSITQQFGLQELTDDEVDQVFAKMPKPD